MGEKKKNVTKYCFLEPPIPVAVTRVSGIPFVGRSKVTKGYGGLVAMRQDKLVINYDYLILYVIDERGKLLLQERMINFNLLTVEPELYARSSSSTQVAIIPKASPSTLVKMALFRKAPLEALPPYK